MGFHIPRFQPLFHFSPILTPTLSFYINPQAYPSMLPSITFLSRKSEDCLFPYLKYPKYLYFRKPSLNLKNRCSEHFFYRCVRHFSSLNCDIIFNPKLIYCDAFQQHFHRLCNRKETHKCS